MANRIALAFFAPIVLCLTVATAANASQTAQRHFQPAPPTATQRVDTIDGVVVISSAGKLAQVGAAFRPLSDKQASLLVSVKNLGTDAVDFGIANIAVLSGDKPLPIDMPESNGNHVRDCATERTNMYATCMASANITDNLSKHGSTSNCLSSTSSAYSNCLASQPDAPAIVAKIAPGQVYPSQYKVDLPKRGRKDGPATLVVVVTVAGETQSFEFKESD
jgi:hypothetical protein